MSGDYMLGFVSALSSTLAIVVLIASVLLVNVLSVSVKKAKKNLKLKLQINLIRVTRAVKE